MKFYRKNDVQHPEFHSEETITTVPIMAHGEALGASVRSTSFKNSVLWLPAKDALLRRAAVLVVGCVELRVHNMVIL